MNKSDDPKRRPVNLSLSPDEKRILDLAAGRVRQKPTTFATSLYRHAFLRYLSYGASLETLLDEDMPKGEVGDALRGNRAGVEYYLTDEGYHAFKTPDGKHFVFDVRSAVGDRAIRQIKRDALARKKNLG